MVSVTVMCHCKLNNIVPHCRDQEEDEPDGNSLQQQKTIVMLHCNKHAGKMRFHNNIEY